MAATFTIGGEITVKRLGFGAMRVTGQPGNFGPYPDWEGAKALLRRAVELGVDHVDTARVYGPGWNEQLVAEALWPYDGLLIATKGGLDKQGPLPTDTRADGRPEALSRHIDESRTRLRVDRIDLYYLHRPDPGVPFAAQVEALAKAREEGRIRMVGLSNVSIEQVEIARAIVPIVAVQNRFNLADQQDSEMLGHAERHGMAYVPWRPLGDAPPQQAGAGGRGAGGAATLRALLARSPNILPIPGTTSIAHLEDNMAAAA